MLQALLVVPVFALVYLIAGSPRLRRRIGQLLLAGLAMVLSAGWWIAIVELVPAQYRPYIGGSQNNSILELTLGYNGLGRITGNETGSVGGGGGGQGGSMWGETGLTRLFDAEIGGQIAWLIPAALLFFAVMLWLTRRLPRTDKTRAAFVLWGGWLLVTGLVFSYMSGITHPYYSVALAPAIAALVAIGGRELWRGRAGAAARGSLGAMIAVTGVWSFILLHRTESWLPAVRWVILVAAIVVAAMVIVGLRATAALATAAIVTVAASSGAYAVATAATTHSGSIPISGPESQNGLGGGPGGEQADSQLAALLSSTTTEWAAATTGSQSAASLELASGKQVIAIGGWDGSDPAPTLAQFQQYVREGKISYYVSGFGMRGGGRGGNSEIAEWVAANYTATTVGGSTVYDLRV
jgi:4-amino-4-deoxy-L-arabinose transferase-like glycosyltransferase